MKPPSILFVVPRFHTNLFFATRALVREEIQVHVLATNSVDEEDHSIVRPIVIGESPGTQQVEQVLEELDTDLILLRKAGELSKQVARVARKRKVKVLAYDLKPLTKHSSPDKRLTMRWRGEPLERVTPVRGLDSQAATDPRAHYLPWPVERLTELPAPPVESVRTGRRLRILCVGKLMQPRKNQHHLIEALRSANLTDRVQLTLAGSTTEQASGADQEHFARLQEAAREDWIDLVCDQPFHRMNELYAASDICVLPAIREPLGHAPTEAMAYGVVPVISTDCGSAGYIEHGNNGLRVDMKKPGDLQKSLKRLVMDRELRTRLSAGALNTAEGELSPERFVERVRLLLENLKR